MRVTRVLRNFLLGYMILHLIVAGVFLFVVSGWLRSRMIDQTQQRMRAMCVILREHVRSLETGLDDASLLDHIQKLARETDARYTLITDDGRVVADSVTGEAEIGDHGTRREILDARKFGIGIDQRTSATLNLPMMYLALPLRTGDDVRPADDGYVRVALNTKSIESTIGSLQRFVWIFAIGLGGLTMVLTALFAAREMRPLGSFTRAADQIAAGRYQELSLERHHAGEWRTLSDAFERMQAELEIRENRLVENNDRLRAVLSGMIEGVLAVDQQNLITLANLSACQMLSVPREGIEGMSVAEKIRIPELIDLIERARQGRAVVESEIETIRPPRRSLLTRITPLSDKKHGSLAIVMHDVTQLRQLETMRSDFIANLSHELKTPLSAIKAYSETLQMGAIDDAEKAHHFLGQIETGAERMDELIRDLIQLSRVETGHTRFELVEVSLNSLCETAVDRFHAEAVERQIELVFDKNQPAIQALTDEDGVITVVENLISNAIRYTRPGGRVAVRVYEKQSNGQSSFEPNTYGEHLAVIEVEDTGIGIAADQSDRIFERFYRVDKARSRDVGGTGLGLAIVKHTAQALRGCVELESRIGQGSIFRLVLPVINEPLA